MRLRARACLCMCVWVRACERASESAVYQATALMSMGKLDRAIDVLQSAPSTDDPVIKEQLGKIMEARAL